MPVVYPVRFPNKAFGSSARTPRRPPRLSDLARARKKVRSGGGWTRAKRQAESEKSSKRCTSAVYTVVQKHWRYTAPQLRDASV